MHPITRTITIALTALMIAAPVASAHLAKEHAGIAKTAAHGQYTPGSPTPVSHPSGVADVQPTPPAGQPTWPTSPRPLAPVRAADTSVSDGDTDWVGFGLGIAAGLLSVAGIGGLARRSRRMHRSGVTA
jgi:hypothetical protein